MRKSHITLLAIYIAILLSTVIYFLYYRFSNPELTETQLFLNRWWTFQNKGCYTSSEQPEDTLNRKIWKN